ncbi:hypothetical protein BKA56DRAFT_719971 [Ilyonectria sp. MPI-CAGE-AT-0026]|nr:hypothetical protein BKA56DRAFT_719971 [Ilyonectria sp. MPI-CAGE-AT-0026]
MSTETTNPKDPADAAMTCPDREAPAPPIPPRGVRTNTADSKASVNSKFTEVISPSNSLLGHPKSTPPPTFEDLQPALDKIPRREVVPLIERTAGPPQVRLDERIADRSSLFGTQENQSLFEIGRYRSSIAGYIVPTYVLPGNAFRAALKDQSPKDEVRFEYDNLWIQLQFFWDTMMRMQPNPVTSDIQEIGHAVDLMADVTVGRLIADLRPGYPPELSLRNIKELRRRLQRLEFVVRSAVNSCGKGPKMYCGCAIGLKRFKNKTSLWARLFGTQGEEPQIPATREFRVRDLARLLRLEDFLTHVSREFQRQLGVVPEPESLVLTTMSFMDEEITACVSNKGITNILDLKHAWVDMMCSPKFRRAVVKEVQDVVNDAVSFKKKYGHAGHRDGCDQKVVKPMSFVRQLSGRTQLGESSGSRGKLISSPLRTFFHKS